MSTNGRKTPGGEISHRTLHFIWIVDCSGSMGCDGKIQTLNMAIKEVIPHMKNAADENPQTKVLVRSISFSNGARWHIAQPTPVENFTWNDLSANGCTDMGKALEMVAEQLGMLPQNERGCPPVLVLLSDGQPTDDFEAGLNDLMNQTWGIKAVRIAIAIGHDANYELLQKFIGHSEFTPLQANNPEALIKRIIWASTVPIKAISSPPSQIKGTSVTGVNIPLPVAPPAEITSANDVW
jgi:uncharacterized protein YegL